MAAVWLVWSCGDPAVLEVGRIRYAAPEVDHLAAEQQQFLADLTALGLATADRRLGEVAEPFVAREIRSLVLQRTALELGAAEAGIDDAALRAAYERDPEHELVVRHLVVLAERWRPQQQRDSARARASEALERARAGEDFEELVAEYSDEPGAAERGGLLQPGRAGSWVPEFWRAAEDLAEGEISEVVASEYGFHVIRLERRERVPFDEARDQVLEEAVDLATAVARSAEWVEERTRSAVVDTPAVRDWQAGRPPRGPLLHWPERDLEPYTAGDLDAYAATLPPASAEALHEGGLDYVLGVLESAARSNVLLEHARVLGIEPSRAQRKAVEERWVHRLVGAAEVLGFHGGMPDRSVREQARDGVSSRRQSILQVRSEVALLSRVLRDLYPVEVRAAVQHEENPAVSPAAAPKR